MVGTGGFVVLTVREIYKIHISNDARDSICAPTEIEIKLRYVKFHSF